LWPFCLGKWGLTVYFCSIGTALNRIGRRAIMRMMLMAALALIWHVLAWKAAKPRRAAQRLCPKPPNITAIGRNRRIVHTGPETASW
jgi:hypothetical protein